ncbi:uncharacterized protein LOC113794351 isoform X2 [Dermatophagoides pteronyssinus]
MLQLLKLKLAIIILLVIKSNSFTSSLDMIGSNPYEKCKQLQQLKVKPTLFVATSMRVLIFTEDFYVFVLSFDSLDQKVHKLKLDHIPMPLFSAYPFVWYYNRPSGHTQNIMKINYFIDENRDEWLCFPLKFQKDLTISPFIYNIQSHKKDKGWLYPDSMYELQEIFIATDHNNFQYIGRRSVLGTGFGFHRIHIKKNYEPVKDFKNSTFYSVCKFLNTPDSDIYFQPGVSCGDTEGRYAVDWNVITGFVRNKLFYIITNIDVLIFNDTIYDQHNNRIKLIRKSHESFFSCEYHQKQNSFHLIYQINIILFIISIILLCTYLLLILTRIIVRKYIRKKLLKKTKSSLTKQQKSKIKIISSRLNYKNNLFQSSQDSNNSDLENMSEEESK